MRLEVRTPSRVVLTARISALTAEGYEGSFGILPQHVDYVSPLVPGILAFTPAGEGAERILAVDRGTLVKVGDLLLVSVRDAVSGDDLETLQEMVRSRFQRLDERERAARSALATLEARFVRRFVEQIARVRD